MKLSFGMIFSIILIVIFIAFAFYGIGKFLGFQKGVEIEKFVADLRSDIEKVWKGSSSSVNVDYDVPADVLRVCFEDDDKIEENMVIRYEKKIDRFELDYLDIEKITADENSFCIESENSKIKMHLQKDFGESKVTILRQS